MDSQYMNIITIIIGIFISDKKKADSVVAPSSMQYKLCYSNTIHRSSSADHSNIHPIFLSKNLLEYAILPHIFRSKKV